MEKHTNKFFREIKDKLAPVRVNSVEVYGEELYKRNKISAKANKILRDLGDERLPKYYLYR